MIRTKAEEAGSRYEEAPTRKIQSTQRGHVGWQLPLDPKKRSGRTRHCPHCGAAGGRDEHAARVLLRWLETRLAGGSGSGRAPSEVWRGGFHHDEARNSRHSDLGLAGAVHSISPADPDTSTFGYRRRHHYLQEARLTKALAAVSAREGNGSGTQPAPIFFARRHPG